MLNSKTSKTYDFLLNIGKKKSQQNSFHVSLSNRFLYGYRKKISEIYYLSSSGFTAIAVSPSIVSGIVVATTISSSESYNLYAK